MKQHYYASSAKHPFSDRELEVLLARARETNARNDVTGLLIYAKGAFIQVIEGPVAAIDGVCERIAKDARHQILMRSERQIQTRQFSDWTMGFVRLKPDATKSLQSYSAIFEPNFDLSVLKGLDPIALSLFEAIRDSVRESLGLV
jgi:hypothetical protein